MGCRVSTKSKKKISYIAQEISFDNCCYGVWKQICNFAVDLGIFCGYNNINKQ